MIPAIALVTFLSLFFVYLKYRQLKHDEELERSACGRCILRLTCSYEEETQVEELPPPSNKADSPSIFAEEPPRYPKHLSHPELKLQRAHISLDLASMRRHTSPLALGGKHPTLGMNFTPS